eukprot:6696263-Prymnesium_polylepis.1
MADGRTRSRSYPRSCRSSLRLCSASASLLSSQGVQSQRSWQRHSQRASPFDAALHAGMHRRLQGAAVAEGQELEIRQVQC